MFDLKHLDILESARFPKAQLAGHVCRQMLKLNFASKGRHHKTVCFATLGEELGACLQTSVFSRLLLLGGFRWTPHAKNEARVAGFAILRQPHRHEVHSNYPVVFCSFGRDMSSTLLAYFDCGSYQPRHVCCFQVACSTCLTVSGGSSKAILYLSAESYYFCIALVGQDLTWF